MLRRADGWRISYIYIYIAQHTRAHTHPKPNPPNQVVEPEALLGASIDYLGDLDGDGKAELIIGAPGMHELRGEAYIVSLDKDAKCVGWFVCWVGLIRAVGGRT